MSRRWNTFQAGIYSRLLLMADEDGMATAEYAIGTLAAAAFAGILLAIVKGGAIKQALTDLIKQALAA